MLGVRFTVVEPHEDHQRWTPGEDPAAYAARGAEEKALAVAATRSEGVVLGADTIVVLDGAVLEKPADADEAVAHLRQLQGREHEVLTGLCLARAGGQPRLCGVERSRVRMGALDDATIRAYVATGEPLDKAGAYGIQGVGGLLVDSVEGCYFNVMGLPLAHLRRMFRELEGRA
jgi:septum formation protein